VSSWEQVHHDRGDDVSWFQERPTTSVRMLDRCGIRVEESVVDVGGGGARLVDELLHRGHEDLTVLDVSAVALRRAARRLGPQRARRVVWTVSDVLAWSPTRLFSVWHDRAAVHFLVDDEQVSGYVARVHAALAPGGALVVATFAPDGPGRCSGLPVRRYHTDRLGELFGSDFDVVGTEREEHHTPWGAVQPFSWVALRRH